MTLDTSADFATPWHAESYRRFLIDTLPTWISRHFPLSDARVEEIDAHSCRLHLTFAGGAAASLDEIPLPDADGVFMVRQLRQTREGERRVVVPRATCEDLETAEIACVGEQLLSFITERLDGEGHSNDPQAFAEAIRQTLIAFFERAQMLDPTNGLASDTHRRRLWVAGKITGFHRSHVGRACPVETPEGPNLGRVLVIARGAMIVNGKLIPATSGAASLGLGAAMIPFVAHSEPARTLMGANMMRQWQILDHPEPPLVTTGMEPPAPGPDYCPGVNLLTAFIAWGADSHEDALVISETTARKLSVAGRPIEIGDKLSNRHGAKGVVSRILPKSEMPHLPDGSPVDICYTFFGLPSRMNQGQLQEAVLGLAARRDGKPAVAPPFAGPSPAELSERLQAAGLPANGMSRLTDGVSGAPLDRASTVGYVLWGRTAHDAHTKIQFTTDDTMPGQSLGMDEYKILRDAGAFATLATLFSLQAQGGNHSRWHILESRLRTVGIAANRTDFGVTFGFIDSVPEGALSLATPLPHPFLPERTLSFLAPDEATREKEEFIAIRETNARLQRMVQSGAPPQLMESGKQALQERIRAFADSLLTSAVFLPEVTVRYSGRAVSAPGPELGLEEVGLPAAMAWGLFGPLVVQEGSVSEADVQARSEQALAALKERMARSRVLINRQPSEYSTSLIALRPVYVEGDALRYPPLLCNWEETDFDGDQLAVYLPLGAEAQRELEERLSIAGHLKRDPSRLLAPYWGLVPGHAVLYGLAERSRTTAGRAEIEALFGLPLKPGLVDRAHLNTLVQEYTDTHGMAATLELLPRVAAYAFAATRQSGASMGPFLTAALPPQPSNRDPQAWKRWADSVVERINALARTGGFDEDTLGAALLAAVSGARGRTLLLAKVMVSVSPGMQVGIDDQPVPMTRGWRDGLTPEQLQIIAKNTRLALHRVVTVEGRRETTGEAPRLGVAGQGVLAQASRSSEPGLVLALAAHLGETDSLTDPEVRLL